MSEHTTEISLPARQENLAALLAWVEEQARRAGMDGAGGRIRLVVEELFTNTLHHGHGGETDAPVSLSVTVDAIGIRLHYRDCAPPFDLTAAPPLPPDSSRLGGVGLNLVRRLADACRYCYDAGCNRVELEFRRPGP